MPDVIKVDIGALDRVRALEQASATQASAITGKQAASAKLTALAALTFADGKISYATGASTFATTDLTAQARTLIGKASFAEMREALGLGIGADVLAFSANLQALAGTASGALGRSLLTRANASQARTDLEIYSAAQTDEALGRLIQTQGAPGDSVGRFTSSLTGEGAVGAAVPGAAVVNDRGAAQRVTGAGIVALRERVRLDPTKTYRIDFATARATDPTDPAGDTVRYGIQWLNKNKAQISQRIVENVVLTVAAGRDMGTVVIGATTVEGVDFAWPATARYAVPFVQTYGADGVTDIEVVDWSESFVTPAALRAFALEVAESDEIALAQLRAELDDGVPDALDTFNKLAFSIGYDVNFADTVGNLVMDEAEFRQAQIDNVYFDLAAQGDAVYQAIAAGLATEGTNRDVAIAESAATKSDRYVEGLTGGLKGALIPAFNRARKDLVGFFEAAGSFESWAFGFVPTRRMTPGGLILHPADVGAVDYLLVQVLRGPADSTLAPNAINDTVIGFGIYPKATWLNPDRAQSAAHDIVLDLSSLNLGPITPDFRCAIRVFAFDEDDDQVNIGYAYGLDAANTNPVLERGYFEIGGTQTAMSTVETLAWAFLELVGQDAASASMAPALPQTVARAEMQAYWPTSAGGANLADTVIAHPAGQTIIRGQLVTFTSPGTTTVTAEPITLQYNQEINLAHQFVAAGTVVFTKTAGSVVLVEGVDYQIDYDQASIKGLINTADIPGTVAYTGRKSRVDTIYADPITGVVGIAAGTARGTDPAEFISAAPDGKVEIAKAFVTVANGVDILDTRPFNGFVPVGGEAEHMAWIETSRQRTAGLTRAMRKGDDIWLIGEGDSITEQGETDPGDHGTPNGTGRDTIIYFQAGRIGSDVRADNTRVPIVSGHTRTGWNWRLKEAIEARSGSTVTYLNMAIGGTRSSNDAPGGIPNGSHPDRLAALVGLVEDAVTAGAQPVVSLAFGMNELGLFITRSNIATIARACQAAGADVIIWGVPLFAELGGYSTLAEWRETNRQIGQAAEDVKAAVVPLWRIADPERNIAALGIPWRAASSANGTNHPGPYELRRYGDFGALLIP